MFLKGPASLDSDEEEDLEKVDTEAKIQFQQKYSSFIPKQTGRRFRFRFRLGWFSIINNLMIIYNNITY